MDIKDQIVPLEKERIQFLSDGVFAIVMTLLVLDIRVPHLDAPVTSAALITELTHMWPNIIGFVMSFLVVAIFWLAHHNMFHYIRKVDRAFLWLNILYLLLVAILPFSTSLLSEYNDVPIAVALYSSGLVAAGLILYFCWTYATTNRRLTSPNLTNAFISTVGNRVLLGPIMFLATAILAFYSPHLAVGIILAVQIMYILPFKFLDKLWGEA